MPLVDYQIEKLTRGNSRNWSRADNQQNHLDGLGKALFLAQVTIASLQYSEGRS